MEYGLSPCWKKNDRTLKVTSTAVWNDRFEFALIIALKMMQFP